MGARATLEKEGYPKICVYCGIKEDDYLKIWGPFYGGSRGKRLEVDHKDNDKTNNNIENLCWACCLCNCAKSDTLTHEEMKDVGAVIGKLWRKRAGIGKQETATL